MSFMTLRADDGSVNDNGLIRIAVGTFQIPSIRSHAVNHQCTALIAMDIRNLFRPVDQAVRLDVLAVRIVRTGKILAVAPQLYNHLCAAFFADNIRNLCFFLLVFGSFHISCVQFV